MGKTTKTKKLGAGSSTAPDGKVCFVAPHNKSFIMRHGILKYAFHPALHNRYAMLISPRKKKQNKTN